MAPVYPSASDYKQWARISDAVDDAAIGQALAAVQAAVMARCPSLALLEALPQDAYYACLLWTNRLLSRRNSPDGIVGVADLGIASVARMDRDISQMLSPWRDPVLA